MKPRKACGIAEGKKRYQVTLTVANVERFQKLCKEIGLPSNTMSNVCNDSLMEVANIFHTAKEQGKFDINDIFRLMGKQVELLMEEEKKEMVARNEGRTLSNK